MRQPEGFGLPCDVQLNDLPPLLRKEYISVIQRREYFPLHGTIFQKFSRWLVSDDSDQMQQVCQLHAEVIAHYLWHTQPRWIFGIPEGGRSLAVEVTKHFPYAQVVFAKKLCNTDDLSRLHNLKLFEIDRSHKEGSVQTIVYDQPSVHEPMLVVDNVLERGFTANSVLDFLITHEKLPVVGLGIGREYTPGGIREIARKFDIPVIAAVNSRYS